MGTNRLYANKEQVNTEKKKRKRNMTRMCFLNEFIIDRHNICYTQTTVLIADLVGKFKKLLDKVAHESKKKGLTIGCKKAECLSIIGIIQSMSYA